LKGPTTIATIRDSGAPAVLDQSEVLTRSQDRGYTFIDTRILGTPSSKNAAQIGTKITRPGGGIAALHGTKITRPSDNDAIRAGGGKEANANDDVDLHRLLSLRVGGGKEANADVDLHRLPCEGGEHPAPSDEEQPDIMRGGHGEVHKTPKGIVNLEVRDIPGRGAWSRTCG
jgi:hypothetical protein